MKNNSILNGSGKYEFTKTEILPKEFTLSQNYPNPFNGSTLISFALPEASKVKIILYSLLGEVIETIVENEFIAGVHQTQFNTQLATGVYYYKFEAVSLTNPKIKLLILKNGVNKIIFFNKNSCKFNLSFISSSKFRFQKLDFLRKFIKN